MRTSTVYVKGKRRRTKRKRNLNTKTVPVLIDNIKTSTPNIKPPDSSGILNVNSSIKRFSNLFDTIKRSATSFLNCPFKSTKLHQYPAIHKKKTNQNKSVWSPHSTDIFSNKGLQTLIERQTLLKSRVQLWVDIRNSVSRRSLRRELTNGVTATIEDLNHFLELTETDCMISLFLERDICRFFADKYLLCMTFTYFIRANLHYDQYTRLNFFAALSLAHDLEEDDEVLKREVFPYALGKQWKQFFSYLITLKAEFFWAIGCRATVSRKSCQDVMSISPDASLWMRNRAEHHSNAFRKSMVNENEIPVGPFGHALCCRLCMERNCEDSDNSYLVYTSSSCSDISWEETNMSAVLEQDSGVGNSLLMETSNNYLT